MKKLAELFLTFLKIGAFTFGGGYAMIPLIEDSCVEKKKWISHDDMMNITVIAESTPGPVAINCATFVGYKQAGLAGAVSATVGVILPSLLIIYLISLFLDRFLEIVWVAKAFRGIKIAVGILITDAGIKMILKSEKKRLPIIILIASTAVMLAASFLSFRISTIALILAAGAVSLLVFAVSRKGREEGK